jgi:hypothetical protein
MIGHCDGGHVLPGRQIHQLRDFTGSIEQRIVGMAMQVNERGGHERSDPGGEFQYSEATTGRPNEMLRTVLFGQFDESV